MKNKLQEMIDSGQATIIQKPVVIQSLDSCVLYVINKTNSDRKDKELKDQIKSAINAYFEFKWTERLKQLEDYKKDAQKYRELKRLLK